MYTQCPCGLGRKMQTYRARRRRTGCHDGARVTCTGAALMFMPHPASCGACTGVREYLGQIRREFEALLAENAAKPEAERLPRSAFEVDLGLREMIAEVCGLPCRARCLAFPTVLISGPSLLCSLLGLPCCACALHLCDGSGATPL